MNLIKSNKKKNIYGLLFLVFGMILVNCSSSILNVLVIDNSYNAENNNDNSLDFQNQTPETSDYQNFNGDGGNLNITLHQSYLNNSFNTNLNTSDSNNNTFTLPCPTDITFNSSYVNITVDNIYAPNKTIILETTTILTEWVYDNAVAIGFQVKGSGILDNFSICFSETHTNTNDALIGFEIFNAQWSNGKIEPGSTLLKSAWIETIHDDVSQVWYNFTNINTFLNVSETYQNYFYLRMVQVTGETQAHVEIECNVNGLVDDAIMLKWSGSTWNTRAFDPLMSIDLKPLSNTPAPAQINLTINDIKVSNFTSGKGYWSPSNSLGNSTGTLNFAIDAEWWDVTCQISEVLINYTKSNLKVSSEFNISGSGQIVQWNVTRNGGLNYFDSSFSNYQINFTIPNIWDKDTIKVFNGSTPKTSDCTNRSLGNGYREVNVLNAGNGTFWYLTANSTNLLSSIDTYVSELALSKVNHSSVVDFNATFSEIIRKGDLNLSVYSPSPQYLNHSEILDISLLSSSDEFLVSSWDISLNVSQYGIFKIEISWNNDTAAGFLESYLTIYGDTDLIPSLPSTNFDASNIFNITVFFNDTGLDLGIDGATIDVYVDENPYSAVKFDYGTGYYNITIDCSDPIFSDYKTFTIRVNASKQYYHNQTETVQFTIYGETELTILDPPDLTVFNSGDTFNVTIFYNETVKNEGIGGATIDVYVDENPYSAVKFDYGTGYY
ncbi:MAG: hypothetical protein HWN79_17365, partial [Candidatus Lokiarchaeota archaeon]|nr:hypothetical protein [Candidatus Lokiarchaeota archaeon]